MKKVEIFRYSVLPAYATPLSNTSPFPKELAPPGGYHRTLHNHHKNAVRMILSSPCSQMPPCLSSPSITPCNKAHRIHQTQQYDRCLAATDTTPPFSSRVHSLSPALLSLLISEIFYTSHNTDPMIPVRPTPLSVHSPSSFRCILKSIPDEYGFEKTYYVVRAKATCAPGYA